MYSCPGCRSTSTSDTGPAAPGLAEQVGDETFVQPNYVVRECADCGLLFRVPTLSQAELDRYYAQTDFRRWEIDDFFPTERCVLQILRWLPNGSRILDFGCSSGRLLAPITATHVCYGIEVNAAAASEAAKKGITMVPDLKSVGRQFDAIVLADVFEHMRNPIELLNKLSAHLADHGVLIVVTGNGDAPVCRRDPALFWYFRHLEHLCMLTRKHAAFISSQLGLRLERWRELSHYDLSLRERVVQIVQNFVFWQFRRRTLLARSALRLLPAMRELKRAKVAPTYTHSKDHVVAVFRK